MCSKVILYGANTIKKKLHKEVNSSVYSAPSVKHSVNKAIQ